MFSLSNLDENLGFYFFFKVNLILRDTAKVLEIQSNAEFEELYEKTAWFYDEKYHQLGAAYDVFARAVR